ncbi:MAG: NAD-dependent epimerase/dehydratase family protein [Rhodospirillaceae bacterium]
MTVQTKTHELTDMEQSLRSAARRPLRGLPMIAPDATIRVCLVGAGVIANIHAEALKALKNLSAVAIVEPSSERARAFAEKWKIPAVYQDLETALKEGDFDAVHILTPPDSHAALTRLCLAYNRHVLIEKPVAAHGADAADLVALDAKAEGVVAGVNQNFIYHPAFTQLREMITNGDAGPLRSVQVAYNVPLRQLAGRQFGSWMFHIPKNILLEQAVHPMSQIAALIGPIESIETTNSPGTFISPGVAFHASCDTLLKSARYTAHLQFAVGRSFPFWQVTAVCDDGVLVADILNSRFTMFGRGPLMEPVDMLSQGLAAARATASHALGNAASYVLSLAKLKGRSDPFFLSMKASIDAYYTAVRSRAAGGHLRPVASIPFAANLVETCEAIAARAFTAPVPPVQTPIVAKATRGEVAVLGGTGFIGAATVARLVEEGYRVRAFARNTRNLAEIFSHPQVSLIRGDIRDPAAVTQAISGAATVINLAHGGGGATWEEIRNAMVGGAKIVADACLAAGVSRLIHVGSIAGLYIGDSAQKITCDTMPDPQSDERADYARAKAEADRMLLAMHKERGLPVCILRPGIVLGHGTSPLHSGVGTFNNEQHCVGWNKGDNPLPLVLVDDVADAIVKAVSAPAAIGRAYNLVGDVRFNARAYMSALARATGRPLRYHPQPVWQLHLEDWGKWAVKRAVGRNAAKPSMRDLRSRGLPAQFDCSIAKRDLNWAPESDPVVFIRRAFA